VWSDATGKWEWSETASTVAAVAPSAGQAQGGSSGNSVNSGSSGNSGNSGYNEGSHDSGWIMLPNGTQVRTQSSWSSSSSSTRTRGGNGNGGRRRPINQSGSSDTGWITLANGTKVRRQKQWSRTSYETSYGGVQLDPNERDELAAQLAHGEVHDNIIDTNDNDPKPWADLDEMKRNMDAKFEAKLPSNIEPGFEDQYKGKLRSKRQSYGGSFDDELTCDPKFCTMIRCKIGPLEPNQGVIFRVRARLFTQTLLEKYAQSVQISSKLVTRITQLPFMADPETISYQTQQVTTEVFPSEMGEGEIPWWVWLLAALLGLLLLAIITLCLYKCGFFKRKRPDASPEREPLNGYH
jgi:hypothetical protein